MMQETILHYFQSISNPFLDSFFSIATMLGEQYVIIAVITWVYWNISKKEGFILDNNLDYSGYFKLVGVATGAIAGFLIEETKLSFKTDASIGIKVLRYIIGISTTIGIMLGFKVLFPEGELLDYIRYLLVGAWISGLFPIIGLKTGLFK